MASVWIKKDSGEKNLLADVAVIKSRGENLFYQLYWEKKNL